MIPGTSCLAYDRAVPPGQKPRDHRSASPYPAKGEIHRIIRRLAEENREVLVLVVSSEEEEILSVADDIAIFRAGNCDGTVYDPSTLRLGDGSLRSLAWHQEEIEKAL